MRSKDKGKLALVLVTFLILLIMQNLAYADFFVPYYKLLPAQIEAQVPHMVTIFLFFINLATNFIIIMILTKVTYEYENIGKVSAAAVFTTFFQSIVNISLISHASSLLGAIPETTILNCLLKGSGVFILSLIPLFLVGYIAIRYIFKIDEGNIFYGLSMAILLNPMYHYLLFYTPIVKLLQASAYVV